MYVCIYIIPNYNCNLYLKPIKAAFINDLELNSQGISFKWKQGEVSGTFYDWLFIRLTFKDKFRYF